MAGKRREPTTISDVADRLRLTREALGLEQTEMALRTGISPQAWNNYERGFRLISREAAIKVCIATGVSLDWIYRGQRALLPMAVEAGMRETEAAPKRKATT